MVTVIVCWTGASVPTRVRFRNREVALRFVRSMIDKKHVQAACIWEPA